MTTDILMYPKVTTPRWKAVIEYRSDNGILDVEHAIEELEELQDIVERGPDWNTITCITVTLDRRSYEVTVEQAATL